MSWRNRTEMFGIDTISEITEYRVRDILFNACVNGACKQASSLELRLWAMQHVRDVVANTITAGCNSAIIDSVLNTGSLSDGGD